MSKENESMIAFRKAGKGFNREDVYKYIEEMNIRFRSEKESLNKEIERLSSKIGNEKEDKQDSETVQLHESLKKAEEANLLLQSENEQLKNQIDELVKKSKQESSDKSSENENTLASVKLRADQIVSDAEVAARLLTERASVHVFEMADEYEKKTVTCALDSLKELEETFLSARVRIKEIQFRMEDCLNKITE